MTAELYGLLKQRVGTVTLSDTRAFPDVVWLDESPRGGRRLFVYRHGDRFEEVADGPVVRLDPTEEATT